jgi:hypothetical protein
MTKSQSLRVDFEKSVGRLDEALALPKDPISPRRPTAFAASSLLPSRGELAGSAPPDRVGESR